MFLKPPNMLTAFGALFTGNMLSSLPKRLVLKTTGGLSFQGIKSLSPEK